MKFEINLKLLLGVILIIFSISRAMAGITIEPTYNYGQYSGTSYGQTYTQYSQPVYNYYYGYEVRYKKCIGNAIYIESTMPNGSKTWVYSYTCQADEECVDGSCVKKPLRINIGSWELSLGPWCSERYVKQYCINDELWALYRNSKCVVKPQFIQRCTYGCVDGRCNSAPQPVYIPSYYQTYYYSYKPQGSSYQIYVAAPQPTKKVCSAGFVCVGNWKVYRNSNCEILESTRVYCDNGCKNGTCLALRCLIPDGSGPYCDCDSDGDCPAGYYCKHTFTYDKCVPIMDP